MRDVSEEFLAAATGSNTPLVSADVWLGSDIIRAGAQIIGGQMSWDSRQAVEDQVQVTILDQDSGGSMLRDIIHSYGCRINVKAGFDLAGVSELVSLGWFDITATDAQEEWRWYDWQDDAVKLSEVVQVTGQGLLSIVSKSGLFTPVQPTPGGDAWTAIAALCTDVVSVLDPGFSAQTLPSGNSAIVFDNDRLKAIQQIASLWGAKPIITDAGQLSLAIPGQGPVTADYGLQINVEQWRNQTASDSLCNGLVFTGQTPDGVELRGYWTDDSGPLFWGGPYGRRTAYQSSPLMTTQAMVDTAAQTAGANLKASRSATQTVNALWNPAQQVRDRPTLQLPDRPVESEILAITLPLPGGPMNVTLQLPLFQAS